MPNEQDLPDLHGYVCGQLSPDEEARLAECAMADQEIFDALWDSCEARELLKDPGIRTRLILDLKASEDGAWRERVRRWFARPSVRAAIVLSGLAAVILALVLIWPRPATEFPLGLVTRPNSDLRSLFRLPLRNPAAMRLALDAPVARFHPGDLVRATLRLSQPAAVFVVRRGPDGVTRLVFPAASADATASPAGELRFVFDPVSPSVDVTARQAFTLRAIALPVGMDLRTDAIEWKRIAKVYSAVEVAYEVVP